MRGLTALRKLKYFSLPNLLAGRELVPELLQHDVTPESMGRALKKILQSREYREEMSREFALLRQQLERSAAEQAAHAVLRTAGLI
jgi:lipid-A-disaccharide synthase